MHERGVDIELLKETLTQACFAPCNRKRQQMMSTLEQMETSPGFLTALMRAIDLTDVGVELPHHCRQLAAIVFKTATMKHWTGDGHYLISASEREEVKEFLLNNLAEPECNISSQLCALVVAIAKYDWPQHWPQLIPALLEKIAADDVQPLVSFRATMYLHSVFQELVILPSTAIAQVFHNTCVQAFLPLIRVWAKKSKWMQEYITSQSSVIHNEEAVVSRDYHFDMMAYQISALMRVLRIILETCLPEIIAKFQSFSSFWKTYLASIQSLTAFVQKVRPLCRMLVDSSHNHHVSSAKAFQSLNAQAQGPVVEHRSEAEVEKCISEKLCAMEEEQGEDQKDYFIARKHFNPRTEGVFSLVNTVLMLLRCQNCTPVVLQRKYPMLVAPWLEALLSFYCKHLVEEYSVARSCPTASNVCDLPLKYLSMASTVFIANVLNCPQYQQAPATALLAPPSSSGASGEGSHSSHPYFIRERFFTSERIQALLERVLRHLLCFTGKDVQALLDEDEVEVFFQQHVAMSWTDDEVFSLRTFAEKVYCGFMQMQPKLCLHVLANHLQQQSMALSRVDFTLDSMSIEDVKLWDNVCYASNLSIAALMETLSFQPSVWIENLLQSAFLKSIFSCQPVASSNQSGNTEERMIAKALLQTRVLWLFHAWMNLVDVKLYPVLLQYLVAILQESKVALQHQAEGSAPIKLCRICLFRTLQALLQQAEFSFIHLIPHLPLIFQEGSQLVFQACGDQDIRVMVLEILHDIVRWMGVIDLSHASIPAILGNSLDAEATPGSALAQLFLQSCQHFTHTWYELSSSDILRGQFLEVLTSLVQSMGKFSGMYPQFCNEAFFGNIVRNMLPIVIQCLQLDAVHQKASCHSPLPTPPAGVQNSKSKLAAGELYVKEGLLLWLSLLRNINLRSLNKDLVCNFGDLFIFAFDSFRQKLDHVDDSGETSIWQTEEMKLLYLSLLETCLLQFGQMMLEIPPAKVAIVEFVHCLCRCRDLQSIMIKGKVCRCFELIIIVHPKEGIALLLETHCLQNFLLALIGKSLRTLPPSNGPWGHYLQTLSQESEVPCELQLYFAAVLGRVLLADPANFLQLLNIFRQETQCPLEIKSVLLFFIQGVIRLCKEEAGHHDDQVLRVRLCLAALMSILPSAGQTAVWKDVFTAQELQEHLFPQVLLLAVHYAKLQKSLLRSVHPVTGQSNALMVLASQFRCQLSNPFDDPFESVQFELADNASTTASPGDPMECWEDLTKHQLAARFLSTQDEEDFHSLLQVLANNSYHQIQSQAENSIVEYEEVVYRLYRQVMSEVEVSCKLQVNEVFNDLLVHWKQVVGVTHYHELLSRLQVLSK